MGIPPLIFRLRLLVFCRRAVIALESIAHSLRAQTQIAESEWAAKNAPKPNAKASFSTFDSDAASKRWNEDQALKGGA